MFFKSIMQSFGHDALAVNEIDIVYIDRDRSTSYTDRLNFFTEDSTISDSFWAFQLMPRQIKVSPIYIAQLKNCLVFPNGIILLSDGSVLLESVFPRDVSQFSNQPSSNIDIYNKHSFENITSNSAACLNLPRAIYCRDVGESGYYHWLSSVLPRIDLVRNYSNFGSLPHLIEAGRGFATDFLETMYADLAVHRANGKFIHVAELIIPSPVQVGSSHYMRNPELLRMFRRSLENRQIVKAPRADNGKRLYVSRADAPMRRLRNEDELMQRIGGFGFTKVSLTGMPVREQIDLFSNASAIVAPHGAGLTNILFSPTSARIIELMPHTRVWPGFRVISAALGSSYSAYVASDVDSEQSDSLGIGNEDFSVHPITCARFIESCLA